MQRPIALVTDCLGRKSLSAIRSLGRSGFQLIAQSEERWTPASLSRYVVKELRTLYDCEQHLTRLQENGIEPPVILPMEETSTDWAYGLRAELARVLLPPRLSFELARSKWHTFELARQLNIPTPATTRILSLDHFRQVIESEGDWILKPEKGNGSSGIIQSDLSNRVPELNSASELWHKHGPYLQQSRIPREGPGIGAAFLFDRGGKCVAQFAHQRLREYPITGGPSTDRIAIEGPVALEALRKGRQILEAWNWVGIAMVEFKVDSRDGSLQLIEVNPRFWGSLELAVRSGADFPALYAKLAQGEALSAISLDAVEYRAGTRVRWTVPGDLLRWLTTPRHLREGLGAFLRGFIRLSEEWDPRDPLAYVGCWIATFALVFKPRYWRYLRR